ASIPRLTARTGHPVVRSQRQRRAFRRLLHPQSRSGAMDVSGVISVGRKTSVVVVPYDPVWPDVFAAFRTVFLSRLEGLAVAVEHVGSTSVPGLCAKPVIDIDIVIGTRGHLPSVIERLESLGYRHVGDLGVPSREAFKRESASVPCDGSGREWPSHHP